MVKDSNEVWHKFRWKDLNFSIGFQYQTSRLSSPTHVIARRRSRRGNPFPLRFCLSCAAHPPANPYPTELSTLRYTKNGEDSHVRESSPLLCIPYYPFPSGHTASSSASSGTVTFPSNGEASLSGITGICVCSRIQARQLSESMHTSAL